MYKMTLLLVAGLMLLLATAEANEARPGPPPLPKRMEQVKKHGWKGWLRSRHPDHVRVALWAANDNRPITARHLLRNKYLDKTPVRSMIKVVERMPKDLGVLLAAAYVHRHAPHLSRKDVRKLMKAYDSDDADFRSPRVNLIADAYASGRGGKRPLSHEARTKLGLDSRASTLDLGSHIRQAFLGLVTSGELNRGRAPLAAVQSGRIQLPHLYPMDQLAARIEESPHWEQRRQLASVVTHRQDLTPWHLAYLLKAVSTAAEKKDVVAAYTKAHQGKLTHRQSSQLSAISAAVSTPSRGGHLRSLVKVFDLELKQAELSMKREEIAALKQRTYRGRSSSPDTALYLVAGVALGGILF